MSTYADLFRYRELFANLFRRDLRAKYKGSLLGVAWSLAHPLMLTAIYLLVFSVLWKTIDIEHYPLYLLTGLAPWIFFSTSLQAAARSLLDMAELVKKVRFPRQLVAFSVVATQLVSFGVMLAILIVLNAAVRPETRDTVVLAIPLAALFVALVAGLALAIACANVVLRDVEHLLSALLLPWFFLTPILYRLDDLPGEVEPPAWLVELLRWGNPVTPPIETLHAVLYDGTAPSLANVAYTVGAAAAALALGALVFRRIDDRIAVEL
jgi:ABC-type polysaccharide/polyol phosphate export permease